MNKVLYPQKCPSCDSPTSFEGEFLVCTNTAKCPAQMVGRIKNWINEINILEWGDTLIQKVVETGKVKTVADLYKLTVDDLEAIDRMGKKSAQKCFDNLWAASNLPLEVFLGGLSIPTIGQSTIKSIMKEGCDTLTKFGQLTATQFEQVPGVGPVKAQFLAKGLKDYQQVILDLLTNGVKIKESIVGKLTGKSFAITGKLSIKRAEVEKIIADNGGEMKSSISKETSYLITSDPNGTSSKLVAAKKLGIICLSETDFFNLIK